MRRNARAIYWMWMTTVPCIVVVRTIMSNNIWNIWTKPICILMGVMICMTMVI